MQRRDFLKKTVGSAVAFRTVPNALATSKKRPRITKPVTIKFLPFWLMDDFAKTLAAEFTAANPHINIQFPPPPTKDGFSNPVWDRTLLKAYQAGDPYDMTLTGPFYSMWATQMGCTIDPTPLFRRDFGKDYERHFQKLFVRWQGKMVGVPFKVGTELFYCNADLITQAGLAPPQEGWTWDDFFKIASQTTKYGPDGQAVHWGCSVYEGGLFRDYIYQEGESLFSRDYRKATTNTPVALAAATAVHDLIFKYRATGSHTQWRSATEEVATSWNHAAFYAGKVALLLDGDLRIKHTYEEAAKTGFSVGVAPPLRRKLAVTSASPTIFQIWKSDNPDRVEAAWEFAKFWLTPANQARMLAETGSAPIRKAAWEEPLGQECLRKWPGLAVFRKAYDRTVIGMGDLPTMTLEYQGIRPFIYRLVLGRLTPAEAVEGMQKKCQAILDDFWAKADKGVYEFYDQYHR